MATETLAPGTCVVRDTASRKGRTRSVDPDSTASRHLHYGRIVLDGGDAPVRFSTKALETGLICLGGRASVSVDSDTYELDRYDALYVPRDSTIEVRAASDRCDLAEIAAPVSFNEVLRRLPASVLPAR